MAAFGKWQEQVLEITNVGIWPKAEVARLHSNGKFVRIADVISDLDALVAANGSFEPILDL